MFQNQVYVTPALGIAGQFASSNPMVYKLSGTGKMVADASGVTVGHFAALNSNGTVTSVPGTAPNASRIGFVHRENNAQITTFLAEASMVIQPGQPVALFGTGDFYAIADVVVATTRGSAILWDVTTGQISVGGTPTATLIDTGYKMISETASTGSLIVISNIGS